MRARSWSMIVACALGAACGGGSSGSSASDGGSDGALGDATASDAPAGDAGSDAPDAGGPVISSLSIVPNPNSVLSATVTFTTDRPALDATLVANLGDGGADNTFSPPPSASATTSHSIRLLGMRASSSFRVTVTATDPATHAASSASTSYTTAALPAVLPIITPVSNDTSATAKGFTLLEVWEWSGQPLAQSTASFSSLVAVDADFQVVWYALLPQLPWAAHKLPNGDLILLDGVLGWLELDMMGNVVSTTTAASLGLDTLHHDLFLEDGGNLLSIATQARVIGGYPGGDGGTTYAVVGDQLAELAFDGGLLGAWSDFSLEPPLSVYDEGNPNTFNQPFWDFRYPSIVSTYGHTHDWTHGNAVTIDPMDGDIVASSHTQSLVYKVSRTGGDGGGPKVVWRFGAGGDFTLTGTKEGFAYGQHDVSVTPSETLLMFDDGYGRPLPQGAAPWSRAVEFSLDTQKHTAAVAWEYREATPGLYSQDFGSATLLDNGDVLIDDGGELDDPQGLIADPGNLKSARIVEVTHATPSVKVAEFDIKVPRGSYPPDPTYSGFTVYRASRITSLYP